MSEKDLVHHHKVLKQFLDISDDSSTKTRTNSSRAARAREKLLKLSGAQFRELSTDVYDELRRRIDESRGEPDFLLPKSSFHPKRNQARQKLSSLPQSRFKDLVSDISYEIERRNLHVPAPSSASDKESRHSDTSSGHMGGRKSTDTYSDHPHTRNASIATRQSKELYNSSSNTTTANNNASSNNNNNNNNNTIHQQQQQSQQPESQHLRSDSQSHQHPPPPPPPPQDHQPSIGVQSTTVVPAKANLTWSSDEEDDNDYGHARSESRNLTDGSRNVSNAYSHGAIDAAAAGDVTARSLAPEGVSAAAAAAAAEATAAAEAKVHELNSKNADLDTLVTSLQSKLEAAQYEKEQLEEKHRLLQDDYEYSSSQNKTLTQEIEELIESKAQWQQEKADYDLRLKDTEDNYIHKNEYDSVKANVSQLRLENQALKNAKDRQQRTASTDFAQQLQQKQISLDGKGSGAAAAAAAAGAGAVAGAAIGTVAGGSSSSNGALQKEMEKFIDQLADVDASRSAVKKGSEQSLIDLKMELAKWQMKYEEIRAGHITKELSTKIMSRDDLKPFISPSGSISFKLVSDLIASVETFLAYLDGENFDSDFLFEKISAISVTANAIATQGDKASLNSNENSILLREAVSFALTSTRYYAIYSNILPKVIVERSLGEVCFSLCDLISISKLSNSEIDSKNITGSANAASALKNDETINNGVRPLRMANKLKESQNSSPQHEAKQHEIIIPKRAVSKTSIAVPVAAAGAAGAAGATGAAATAASTSAGSAGSGAGQLPTSRNASAAASKTPQSPNNKAIGTSPRTSGVAYLAKRLSASAESSPVSSPSRITPTKSSKSILDKMKQFESPPENISKKINGLSEPFKPEAEADKPKNGSSSGGKGFFQSIRDKLTSAENEADTSDLNNTTVDKDISTSHTTPANDNVSVKVPLNNGNGSAADYSFEDRTEKPSPVNFSKHKVNVVNIDDSKNTLGRSDSAASSSLARKQSTESKSSFHSTFQSPPSANNKNTASSSLKPASKSVKMADDLPTNNKNVKYVEQNEYINHPEDEEDEDDDEDDDDDEEDPEEAEARQRQEYRKSMAAATFNVDLFDIDDPDNTLTQVLLYLEHQTVQVISTIQSLLSAIKKPQATRGDLREKSKAITVVISQMTEATNTSMNQTRNAQLKEHGSWVVKSLEDCNHRMNILCKPNSDRSDDDFADKNFKQRLAGISFDIAKCTKELVKTVEEASLKEDIANLDARLSRHAEVDEDDLT